MIIGINNSEEMHQKIMSGEMYGTIDNKMEDQVMEICRLMQAILKKDTGSYQKVWYSTPKAIVKSGRNRMKAKRKEELKIKNSVNQS